MTSNKSRNQQSRRTTSLWLLFQNISRLMIVMLTFVITTTISGESERPLRRIAFDAFSIYPNHSDTNLECKYDMNTNNNIFMNTAEVVRGAMEDCIRIIVPEVCGGMVPNFIGLAGTKCLQYGDEFIERYNQVSKITILGGVFDFTGSDYIPNQIEVHDCVQDAMESFTCTNYIATAITDASNGNKMNTYMNRYTFQYDTIENDEITSIVSPPNVVVESVPSTPLSDIESSTSIQDQTTTTTTSTSPITPPQNSSNSSENQMHMLPMMIIGVFSGMSAILLLGAALFVYKQQGGSGGGPFFMKKDQQQQPSSPCSTTMSLDDLEGDISNDDDDNNNNNNNNLEVQVGCYHYCSCDDDNANLLVKATTPTVIPVVVVVEEHDESEEYYEIPPNHNHFVDIIANSEPQKNEKCEAEPEQSKTTTMVLERVLLNMQHPESSYISSDDDEESNCEIVACSSGDDRGNTVEELVSTIPFPESLTITGKDSSTRSSVFSFLPNRSLNRRNRNEGKHLTILEPNNYEANKRVNVSLLKGLPVVSPMRGGGNSTGDEDEDCQSDFEPDHTWDPDDNGMTSEEDVDEESQSCFNVSKPNKSLLCKTAARSDDDNCFHQTIFDSSEIMKNDVTNGKKGPAFIENDNDNDSCCSGSMVNRSLIQSYHNNGSSSSKSGSNYLQMMDPLPIPPELMGGCERRKYNKKSIITTTTTTTRSKKVIVSPTIKL